MPRRAPGIFPPNPFLAWGQIGLHFNEMLFASALVIHHRSGRIAAAGVNPGARDRREFMLMGQEKLEAAAESMQAMASRMTAANVQLASQLAQQMMGAGTGMLSMWTTPALFWTGGGHAKAMRSLLAGGNAMTALLSGLAAGVARHGLRPIHSRATANARRLVYRPARSARSK